MASLSFLHNLALNILLQVYHNIPFLEYTILNDKGGSISYEINLLLQEISSFPFHHDSFGIFIS